MKQAANSVGTASLILVLGFIGSRALGVVRNMVLASAFGAGPELDAYFAAFRLPDAIFQLLVGAALGSAFIPTFTTLFTRASPDTAWRLASTTLNLLTLLGGIAAAIAFVLAPWLVPLTVPGFSQELQHLTIVLTQVMLLSSVFFCASGMVTGILNARFYFLLPAIAPWLYNLAIIGATLFFAEKLGTLGPAIGVTIGAALHLLVQLPGLAKVGARYHLIINLSTEGLNEVFRLMGPRLLGLATIQVNWIVTTILASTLSSGNLAALNYAWTVTMLPLGILGMAPATAAFPALAQAAAEKDWVSYQRTLVTGLRLSLFLTIPASVGLMLLREPLVALLFQHGLFEAESARLTSTALLFYAAGLFAHVVLEMVARGSYALSDTKTPFMFAVLGMVSHALLSLALIGPMGVGGLALAMSVSATLEAGGLLFTLSRRIKGFEWAALGATCMRTLAATAVMGLAVSGFLALLFSGRQTLWQAFLVSVGGGLGVVVFLGTAVVLRSPELEHLRHQLRFRRSARALEKT